jgi:hypothetical protein
MSDADRPPVPDGKVVVARGTANPRKDKRVHREWCWAARRIDNPRVADPDTLWDDLKRCAECYGDGYRYRGGAAPATGEVGGDV